MAEFVKDFLFFLINLLVVGLAFVLCGDLAPAVVAAYILTDLQAIKSKLK